MKIRKVAIDIFKKWFNSFLSVCLNIHFVSVTSKPFGLLVTILVAITIQSCEKSDPGPVVCSCEANGADPFADQQGIVVNTAEGYFFLSPSVGYLKPCAPFENQLEVDALMVKITGIIKITCDKPDDIFGYQKQSYVVIELVNPTIDSLFSENPFNIQIIKSEDYGFPEGFGYKISHENGLNIVQPTLPAVGGNKPFLTKADAFKTAVLVAYKINLNIGLPSITIQDLRFLKVLY